MPPRNPRQAMLDIIGVIEEVRQWTEGRTIVDYAADSMMRRAIQRALEIVSEASRHLPRELKAERMQIPWSQIAKIGNVLRHRYDEVSETDLWTVVTLDLPALETVVRRMLEELDKD